MTTSDFTETFRQEAQELLDQLEQALLDLEQSPGDRELIDSAFRALHTIKGSGAMFGFEAVAAFAHGFETSFDRVRKGEAEASPGLIRVALAAKDHIRTLVERPADADPRTGEAILADLREVMAEGAEAPAHAPLAAARTGWRFTLRLPADCLVNGTNPLLLLDELRALGDCTIVARHDAVPTLDELDPETLHLAWDVELVTAAPRQAIDEVFMFVLDEGALAIEPLEPAVAAPLEQRPSATEAAHIEAKPARREAETPVREPAKPGTSLRVQAERLDELMDRVGELVIAQARLSQLASASAETAIKSIAEEIERLASGLRDTTMGIRMVPIGSLFGRFRRLVHDLAHDLGKQVELTTTGEETELDKTMIERLADPLVHIIRNAIDHGLETPADRVAGGKLTTGAIQLVARHSGAEVLVSIGDDGRGLDRNRIRAKAEENGLLAPGAEISDAELFQFLFHPGFSTAREISAVSGRGVGMDVVKRTIEALRGSIDIATEFGHGTTVTLRLPLTLAIIDGLLVRVGQGRYAIPLSAVEECVALSEADDRRSAGRSFLNIRGDLVPFLRLRELFDIDAPPDLHQRVVIVGSGDLRVGLVVDQIIGSHQTVIKSLSKLHSDVETFSGATILGDGTVALILDVPHLVEVGQAREERLKAGHREVA